jgi:hypothetical protein
MDFSQGRWHRLLQGYCVAAETAFSPDRAQRREEIMLFDYTDYGIWAQKTIIP